MKVLFLTASPTYVFLDEAREDGTDEVNYPKLDFWPELREVTDALFEARSEGYADLEIVPEVRTEDLTRYLSRRCVNVLHFSGHGDHMDPDKTEGTREANLIMRKSDTTAGKYVDNTWLREQISDKGINILLLNCCWSEPIAEKLKGAVDLVIGTKVPLRSDIAVKFSRTFYEAAQEGLPLSNIVEKVKAIDKDGSVYVYLPRDSKVLDQVVLPSAPQDDDKEEAATSNGAAKRVLAYQKRLEGARENLAKYLRHDLIYVSLAFIIAVSAHLLFSHWACEECLWNKDTAAKTCPATEGGCEKTCSDCQTSVFDLSKLGAQYQQYLAELLEKAKWLKYEPYALMAALAAGPLARLAAAIPIFIATGIGRNVLPLLGARSRERILLDLEDGRFGDMEEWLKEFES